MSFAAERDYAPPTTNNASTYQSYASGPREYRRPTRPSLTEYLQRVQEKEEMSGMSTTPPQSDSESDVGHGSPSPAPMVRDAFPTNMHRTASWAAAHVASDALQNNTKVVLGAQAITNDALSRPGSSNSSNSTRSSGGPTWRQRLEARNADRKTLNSALPPPPPLEPRKYSESWERLSRGEVAPAPPRPASSSSEDGTYPPGPDRDFGWLARQRERDERILAIKLRRGPLKFGRNGKPINQEKEEKENVPPIGAAAAIRESASAIGAPTTTRAKEKVPDQERQWAADTDFTAMSVHTSPQLKIRDIQNVPHTVDQLPSHSQQTPKAKEPEEPIESSRSTGTPQEEVWDALRKLSRMSTPSPHVVPQKPKSDIDPEERITGEAKLFELQDNKSEKNSIRAPSPIPPSASPSPPSTDTSDDGNVDATPRPKSDPLSLPAPQIDTHDEDSVDETPRPKPDPMSLPPSNNNDIDETPRPKVDPLTLPTPKVTGAYLETPAPTIRKPRPSLTKPEISEKQKPSTKPESGLAKQPRTITNSANPPTFKEDLRRIQLESNYEDSTLDDFSAMLSAPAPAPSQEADTDEIRLQRMSHSLSKNLLSIRDAKAGISRLENQVSSSMISAHDDGYIKIAFPRWWFTMLASLLGLFMLWIAVGAGQYYLGRHVVPYSAEDWWGGRSGPAVSFAGGKEVFEWDEFL